MAKSAGSLAANPAVALLIKHHFWLLTLLVPLVLLPLLFVGRAALQAEIEGVREQIKSHLSAMQSVRKIPQHPNQSWSNDIDKSTMRVKRETFGEWQKFWASQQPIRVWPESLGEDFLKQVAQLKPDGKLSRKLLERYQNNAKTLVHDLPARMGVEDMMVDPNDLAAQSQPRRSAQPESFPQPGFGPGSGPGGGVVEASPYVATWSPENQQRIATSFDWDKAPSTAQVLLAQEELWVYGLLCDTVARLNKSATGPHNAAIAAVEELSVGYPAAEDNPGGGAGGRLTRTMAQPGAEGMSSAMPPPDPGSGAAGPAGGRPPNPRFLSQTAGSMRISGPGAEEGGAATVDTERQLRNWIYVDFSGKPLTADELEAAADSQMVHLMPFVLRAIIDQRQIDPLLVDLAMAPIPIDVRQVRINPSNTGLGGGAMSGMASGMMSMSAPASSGSGSAGTGVSGIAGRFNDVILELRGTIGLATPPDLKKVGLEKAAAAGDGESAGEGAE